MRRAEDSGTAEPTPPLATRPVSPASSVRLNLAPSSRSAVPVSTAVTRKVGRQSQHHRTREVDINKIQEGSRARERSCHL